MPNEKRDKESCNTIPVVQYFTAQDIMASVGVGRTKAYGIIKALNTELEKDGYLTFPGKVPARKFCEKLYLDENKPKGR